MIVIAICSLVINGLGIAAGVLSRGGGLEYMVTAVACFGSLIATTRAMYFAVQTSKHRHQSTLAGMMISLAAAAALLLLATGALFI
jgi:hypothetical protein